MPILLSVLVLPPPSMVPAVHLGSGMTHCCANVFVSPCWPDGACQPSLLWLEMVWVSFTPLCWAEAWEWILPQQKGSADLEQVEISIHVITALCSH